MIRTFYSLAMWLAQPLLKRKLRARAENEPRYGQAIAQRFGTYDEPEEQDGNAYPFVWVHAVSLGETRAAAVLVAGLRARYPGMRLLLTHGTATGWEQGTSLLQAGDVQVWQPWDTPGAVRRFLNQFKPRIGLLMETEVWPNWVAICRQLNVPLCLVNARLSEKSLQQAQRLSWLSHPAYGKLAAVWAQTEDDAKRLRVLGAPVAGITGNLKFDASPDPELLDQGRAWRPASHRPLVMFASSREGEEQMWLDALQRYALQHDGTGTAQWLIVPRHPQRFDAVAALLTQAGLSVSRRSTWESLAHDDDVAAADVILGDSLGEMALYFGMADVALLGGSFAPLGGQNLIEAAACACPIFMGPSTFNFAQAAETAAAAHAAFACAGMDAAVEQALQMVAKRQVLEQTRRQALAWSQAHRGATERTLQGLAPYLPG